MSVENSAAGDHNVHHPAGTLLPSSIIHQEKRATNNFNLHTSTCILFGKGVIVELRDQIPQDAHVLVIYDGGSVKKTGVLARVQDVLKGLDVLEFDGIEPSPFCETLVNAVRIVHDEGVTLLLAIGGGSVLDGTKFIAVVTQYADNIDSWRVLETHGNDVINATPMGSVLVLPVTGSGSNSGAVISCKTVGDKLALMTPFVQPVLAVLNLVYTYTLPPCQVVNGAMDAFVHTVEQYVTYLVDGRIQDRFAESILLTLVKEGPKTLQGPENYNVRANVMWTVTQALNSLIGAGVSRGWVTYMLGYELTAMHGLDHVQTLTIALPALWSEKRGTKRAKLPQYAERIQNTAEGSDDQRTDAAITVTRTSFEQMGVPTRLSDHGLDGSSIPALLEKLEAHGGTQLSEYQDTTLGVSCRVYETAH